MYSTCLFCQGNLGTNEAVEHFPVGRRLAFDAAKGRLWVVCRSCERWNLTPLEERWEAIEECESAFRATKLRVSTDHIGLARLKEGLELVRIGSPQRPEMAAWRYGDQFGRRRRKHLLFVAGGVAAVGTAIVAGPALGLVGGISINPAWQILNAGRGLYRAHRKVRIPRARAGPWFVRFSEVAKTKLYADPEDEIRLRIPTANPNGAPWWRYSEPRREVDLTGAEAVRAAGILLPRLNQGGGSQNDVRGAVGHLEETADPMLLFRRAAGDIAKLRKERTFRSAAGTISSLPTTIRLALEMATHEDSERRALEGELHILEAAWKDAEEIAGIADDMFLPAGVDDDLARLKKQRETTD